MGHVCEEFCFGEIGRLRLEHRFVRERGGGFCLLFRSNQRGRGIPTIEEASELGTIALEERSVVSSLTVEHHTRSLPRHGIWSRTNKESVNPSYRRLEKPQSRRRSARFSDVFLLP